MLFSLLGGVLGQGTHQTYSLMYANQSLGQQDELKQTFQKILPMLNISTLKYSPTFGKTYIIDNFTMSFTYLDADQRSEFVALDVVRVSGGALRIDYNFDFEKKQIGNSVKGKGKGTVTSDKLSYVKDIQLTPQFDPRWDLSNSTAFSISNLLNIERLDPPQADESIYEAMLNTIIGQPTVKNLLLSQIGGLYSDTLNSSLHNQVFHYDKTIEYSFYPSNKPVQTLTYKVNINLLILDEQQLSTAYQMDIPDYPDFDYGADVPTRLIDPSYYGGIQSVYSFKLLESTMKYAITKGWFDTTLNAALWTSNAFTFHAGDVYDAIHESRTLPPATLLRGNCSAQLSSASLVAFNSTTLKATIIYNCDLSYERNQSQVKMINLKPVVYSWIKVGATQTQLMFEVIKCEASGVIYTPVGRFDINNKGLADYLVNSTVQAMVGQHVFGNGFTITKRRNPNVNIDDKVFFIYDSANKPKGQAEE